MFGQMVGREDPGRGRPKQEWPPCQTYDFTAFEATLGFKPNVGDYRTFGIQKLIWTKAANRRGGDAVVFGGGAGS